MDLLRVGGQDELHFQGNYFFYHHTHADNIIILDSAQMDRTVAIWATHAFVIASLPAPLPRGERASAEELAEAFDEDEDDDDDDDDDDGDDDGGGFAGVWFGLILGLAVGVMMGYGMRRAPELCLFSSFEPQACLTVRWVQARAGAARRRCLSARSTRA